MGAPQGWEEVGQKDKATIKSFVRNHQPLCRPQVCLTVSQRRKGDHHHHHHHHHHHLTFQSGNCKRVSKRANPKNVGKGRQDVPSKNQHRKKKRCLPQYPFSKLGTVCPTISISTTSDMLQTCYKYFPRRQLTIN